MDQLKPDQLVQFDDCDRRNLVGRVVRVISNSEPAPLSKDYMALVSVDGDQNLLKRLSELQPLRDRTDHIIATEDVIG